MLVDYFFSKQYLSWIATGTGLFFAAIFHIGTKEPQKCQSKESATTDCTVRQEAKKILPFLFRYRSYKSLFLRSESRQHYGAKSGALARLFLRSSFDLS